MFIKIVIVLLLLIVAASLLGGRQSGGNQRSGAKPGIRPLMLRVAMVLLGIGSLALVLHLSACSMPGQAFHATEVRNAEFGRLSALEGLTDHTGRSLASANFSGKAVVVFFGYTHCPDICPDTLFKTGTAMTMLPDGVKPPRTVLISVDPARDTPEALSQYIRSNGFPADIVGLTGTLEELQQVADALAAPFSRDEEAEGTSGYIVNHSAILYLMDENWKLQTFFMQDESAEAIASCLKALD